MIKQYLLSIQKQFLVNLSLMSRNRYQGQSDDIKKGLQRIKQAQIQVMRQLRKQEPQISRNYSLSYSKQSNMQNRYSFGSKLSNESAAHMRQKIQNMEKEGIDFTSKEMKLRQQIISLAEQARKNKQACQKAQSKMREYQRGQQRALSKAQQAISNAINSEKRYIQLKGEYDKILRQRQRQLLQIKRLQIRQIQTIQKSQQPQPQLIHKIMKQFRSANEAFSDLLLQVNSHKCVRKQTKEQNSKNSSGSSFFSVNTFTISTYEVQAKLQKNINNIIGYLSNLQTYVPINQFSSRIYAGGNESNNFLSVSFKDEIKNIEEQMNFGSEQKENKLNQLRNYNQILERKNTKLQGQVRQHQQEISVLKGKIKQIGKQSQQLKLKLSKVSEQLQKTKYEQNSLSTQSKQKQKRNLFEKYKVNEKGKLYDSTPDQQNKHSSLQNTQHMQISQTQIQLFQDRIVDLQKQNYQLQNKIKQKQKIQKQHKDTIQKLQKQLQKQMTQKLNLIAPLPNFQQYNYKTEQEWKEMVDEINNLSNQKQELQNQRSKFMKQIQELQRELNLLKKEIEQLRKFHNSIQAGNSNISNKNNSKSEIKTSTIGGNLEIYAQNPNAQSNLNKIKANSSQNLANPQQGVNLRNEELKKVAQSKQKMRTQEDENSQLSKNQKIIQYSNRNAQNVQKSSIQSQIPGQIQYQNQFPPQIQSLSQPQPQYQVQYQSQPQLQAVPQTQTLQTLQPQQIQYIPYQNPQYTPQIPQYTSFIPIEQSQQTYSYPNQLVYNQTLQRSNPIQQYQSIQYQQPVQYQQEMQVPNFNQFIPIQGQQTQSAYQQPYQQFQQFQQPYQAPYQNFRNNYPGPQNYYIR